MTDTQVSDSPTWVRDRIRRQFSELARLSFPMVFQRLGIMTMGLVDTLMVGRYSSTELAYQSIGNVPVSTMIVLSIGLMTGTMVLASNAYGAEQFKRCGRIWRRGVLYGLFLGMIGFAICMMGEPLLLALGQEADVARGGGVMMQAIAFGIPMTNVMLACTFFLEGVNRPLPGMMYIFVANLINIILNWAFVYGHWGFDPMGAEGSAWATTIVRTFLALALVIFVWRMKDHARYGIREKVDLRLKKWKRQRNIGYASGLTVGMEHSGFAALQVMAGWLGPLTLGAFAITFNVYGLPFMIAYGVSGATSVRVGIALGRRDHRDLLLAGSCGLIFNMILMVPLMAILLIYPGEIAGLFTIEQDLIVATIPLMILTGWMLLVDSAQAVIGNGLRGRRDVWLPTALYFLSYIVIMTPLAWYLAFPLGRGAEGLFESTVIASIVSCILLVARFYYLSYLDFAPERQRAIAGQS
ncbi:MATE family efflux transporter [Paremcibacter congregatus]|uniref:MATE family efflux transporter n=1 Tax=Paremcibacter congregatus TaxID=2043170 RepID=UPI0030EC910C|tara:strand:- start:283 stop:1686 length:1404 start_codon:yes stop_codon:yes gene_type:complete